MRTILAALLSVAALAGCAHARDELQPTTVMGDPAPPAGEREVIAVAEPAPAAEAPPARPRLSRTITLGEGTDSQYTVSAPPPVPPQGQGQPPVVVNNNIVVHGGGYAPGYGGYGYSYGTGYRGFGGRTTTGDGRGFGSSGSSRTPQWGSSGWEGARRTAAPGQTPGVGGNWSAPPSFGPATMK